jgi:hypothetical protein
MNLSDILTNANSFIGDSSTDRISSTDRYQAATEATAWLLEELGNEHMTDRVEIQYLPTVQWTRVDNLSPYLLTSGQLTFKEEMPDGVEFQRIEPRDLSSTHHNHWAYAIERYNDNAYLGIVVPDGVYDTMDLIPYDVNDGYTYTGTNATNIVGEENDISFDMDATGVAATSLDTTSSAYDISAYSGYGNLVVEVELPDITDITSISIKYGTDLTTNYYLDTVTTDVGGNAFIAGVNTLKFKLADATTVGSPSLSSISAWSIIINHTTSKPVVTGFKISDLRIVKPIYLNFEYIFYRVGTDASGSDIIEFTADTDIPFFINRYPQYRFAVAHKAAAALHRSMQNWNGAGSEEALAEKALARYRKNFSGDRDMPSSTFKVAGVNLRGRRIRRIRN